jgi:peptidoglycan-associated lipoprotein
VDLVLTRCVAMMLLAVHDALLELYFGPVETDGVELKQVEVRLDGKPLPLPTSFQAAERPQLEVPIPSGPHAVDVEVRLDGQSGFFSYLDDYRFKLGGHLDLQAHSGEVTAVKASVERKSGFLVPWESKYRLALSATSYVSDRVAEKASGAKPATPALVAVTPATSPAPVAAAPVACVLDPVLFELDRATLTAASAATLGRFAACLAWSSVAVRLEGHCDQRGSAAYNQALGQRRADAVLKDLRQKGVAATRLSGISFGKSRPPCDEATEACHARSRRVEAVLAD